MISIVLHNSLGAGWLRLYLTPGSGYYFGRTVAVTYNGISADVDVSATHDWVWADVDLCTPVEWGGIKVKDKVYDGTTDAELDFSEVTLTGVSSGDDVQLECRYPSVSFRDAEVGGNKPVDVFAYLTLTGNDAWKYRLTDPYLYGEFTASITAAPVTPPSSGGGSVTTYPVTTPADVPNGTVTVSPANAAAGATVTVTPTPAEGYALDTLTATDKNGNAVTLTEKDGKYTFTMPASKVAVNAAFAEMDTSCDGGVTCPAHPFTDVDTGLWYHEAVDYVMENGLMNGNGDSSFAPDNTLTRAQLAQILYNSKGRPAVSGSSGFADVAEGAWYADAVHWAAENGIVGGYGNGDFGSNDPITREQLAVMLWRYAGSPAGGHSLEGFSDAGQISDYALEAMKWANENGIINGTGGGILDPKGSATRAQAAQMLMNFRTGIEK